VHTGFPRLFVQGVKLAIRALWHGLQTDLRPRAGAL